MQGTKNDQRVKQEVVKMMNGTGMTEKLENNKKISKRNKHNLNNNKV